MRSLTTTSVSIPDFDPRMATGQGASKMAVHYFTPNNPALVPTHRVAVYQNPDITTVVDDSTNLHTKTTEHAADRYPRTEFYKKFQGEIEEHDQDFEKRYGGDLDTTLIFSGLFSAVTSTFIIDVQSELKPNYEEMNNTLLELLFNVTTGSPPADPAKSLPRWKGPDPVIVQVQCVLYAALTAALLASLLAMLGKQWLNRYRQSETHGSTVDRSRVRGSKLSGIEAWKFRFVMESLPVILQCALVLLGFALSRYLWGMSRSVSSVVIGFTSFGLLFYLLLMTMSIFSFDCPFQTPSSLAIRFVIDLAVRYWRILRQTSGPKQQPPQPGTPSTPPDSLSLVETVGREEKLESDLTPLPCIVLDVTQAPDPYDPLFRQEVGLKEDVLDAKCITRMFVMSTDPNTIALTMDFIPEIIWHSGIKDVPLKRIHDTLINCFNFSGPSPVIIPKSRDAAYLSAKAFVHIELQRRCIPKHGEHKQDAGWEALRANYPLPQSTGEGIDPDLGAVLFMVDMTLGRDNGFPWKKIKMTPSHHAWMSHVFIYHVWHEKKLSKVVMDFVENAISVEPSNEIVITDCLFIIGLIVGVPFNVSDITVQDKSLKQDSILRKTCRNLSTIFSSKSIQPSALHALQLMTWLPISDISVTSYDLFKTIMASSDLTEQHLEAARIAIQGAFRENSKAQRPEVVEPEGMLKFLVYHLGLPKAEEHETSIALAFKKIFGAFQYPPDPLIVECIRNSECASPSFVEGVRSIMHPSSSLELREEATWLVSLASDQWFNSAKPIMTPEAMSKFCEHLAVFAVDGHDRWPSIRGSVTILFGMFCSPKWREHIVTSLWKLFYYHGMVEEEESFRSCLRNAIELLNFMRGLPDDQEGLRWWYMVLWHHWNNLDTTVWAEVKRIMTEATEARRAEAERFSRDMPYFGCSLDSIEGGATEGPYPLPPESDESSESWVTESDLGSTDRSVRNNLVGFPLGRDWPGVQPPTDPDSE